MILIDTSVWVDHLRHADATLASALASGRVVQHPFVTAELALGSIAQRPQIVAALSRLPPIAQVDDIALIDFIDATGIHGSGIGLVDAHLLASAAACAGTTVWSRDKRLAACAEKLELAFRP